MIARQARSVLRHHEGAAALLAPIAAQARAQLLELEVGARLLRQVEGVRAVRIGGVMITRIPPGGRIEPHADDGWHAKYYNTKLYVVLQSNPQCVNRVEDERVSMAPGEVWYFDNLKEHEVVNDGPDDRITLIICLRCDR